jgi:preprotein translocase subunit YajC
MAKKLQITQDMMDKLHKGEEITIDGITFDFEMNEAKIELDDETKFVIDLKHLLDKHVMPPTEKEDLVKEAIKSVLSEKKKKKKKRDRCLRIADRKFKKPSAYKSGAVVRCRKGNIWKGLKEEQITIQEIVDTLLEKKKKKKETLRTWFKRSGAPGKTGGWVDCNAPIYKDGKKKGYKPCGRKKGEKRSYPACKPTPAKCKDKGKGKTWGKKAAGK